MSLKDDLIEALAAFALRFGVEDEVDGACAADVQWDAGSETRDLLTALREPWPAAVVDAAATDLADRLAGFEVTVDTVALELLTLDAGPRRVATAAFSARRS